MISNEDSICIPIYLLGISLINFDIESYKDSESLIEAHPEDIFVLGRYISENHKPREWLFIGEQAFLRSWNNLNR